jgi:hypothetical protein
MFVRIYTGPDEEFGMAHVARLLAATLTSAPSWIMAAQP